MITKQEALDYAKKIYAEHDGSTSPDITDAEALLMLKMRKGKHQHQIDLYKSDADYQKSQKAYCQEAIDAIQGG